MGLFNSIYVNCPKCDELVEFQTKSGSCILSSFHISDVPKEELKGIMGDEVMCDNCGYVVSVGKNEERLNGTKFVE